MGLVPPLKVGKLQEALHTKAKGSPNYRFYALYDKVWRRDVLEYAFHCCLANKGTAGVDGVTFEQIKEYGEEKWLDELTEDLRQQDVPTPARPKGEHPQGGPTGQNPPVGNSVYSRSRRANGRGSGLGADLRGRPGARAIRVSSGTERERRRKARRIVAPQGFHGGG